MTVRARSNDPAADLETVFASFQMSLRAHQRIAPKPPAADAVPVVVLTGFLGSGKSSLLVALVRDPPQGLTVRAVVNDVGALGFDPSLLDATHGSGGPPIDIELSNGCGCCVAVDDLAAALHRAADKRPGLIVLEASGIADPFALAQIVEADPSLSLDRIITAVDAAAWALSEPPVPRPEPPAPWRHPMLIRQLDAADSVVATKTDLVAPHRLADIVDSIAESAAGRPVSRSTAADPATRALLPTARRGAGMPVDARPVEHETTAITFDQISPVDRRRLEASLERPSAEAAAGDGTIWRCKGVLRSADLVLAVQTSSSGWDLRPITRHCGPARLTVVGSSADAVRAFAEELGCLRETVAGSW